MSAPPDHRYTTAQLKDTSSRKRGSSIERVPRDLQVEGGALTCEGTHVDHESYKYAALGHDANSIRARGHIL